MKTTYAMKRSLPPPPFPTERANQEKKMEASRLCWLAPLLQKRRNLGHVIFFFVGKDVSIRHSLVSIFSEGGFCPTADVPYKTKNEKNEAHAPTHHLRTLFVHHSILRRVPNQSQCPPIKESNRDNTASTMALLKPPPPFLAPGINSEGIIPSSTGTAAGQPRRIRHRRIHPLRQSRGVQGEVLAVQGEVRAPGLRSPTCRHRRGTPSWQVGLACAWVLPLREGEGHGNPCHHPSDQNCRKRA